MSRRELLESDDALAAAREMIQRCAAHSAQTNYDRRHNYTHLIVL
jgi:hypothetical protein